MNKKPLAWMAFFVLIASSLACSVTIFGVGDEVRGSGTVVEEERSIAGVTAVSVSNQGDLIVEFGDEQRLVIEAEDNLLPYIETRVSSGRLEIETQGGADLRNTKPIRYYLTVKALASVETNSSGSISAAQVTADDFSISVNSSGDVNLAGLNAQRLEVKISSSGSVKIADGVVDEQTIRISSSGNYDAVDLESREARVDLSSSGDAEISVSEQLRADLSSSGNLTYYGDPDVDARQTSSGDVSRGD